MDFVELLDEFMQEVMLCPERDGSSDDKVGFIIKRLTDFKFIFKINIVELNLRILLDQADTQIYMNQWSIKYFHNYLRVLTE